MGAFTIEFESNVLPGLKEAIDDALANEVKDAAVKALRESADKRIYSYDASDFFYEHRRYSFSDENNDESYISDVADNTLTITAYAPLQQLFGGRKRTEDLGDVIAYGYLNFNQPDERPWMDEGIEENIPQIEAALAEGLRRQGY